MTLTTYVKVKVIGEIAVLLDNYPSLLKNLYIINSSLNLNVKILVCFDIENSCNLQGAKWKKM